MTEKPKGMATGNIHLEAFRDALGSPHLPLYDTTTFKFDTTKDLLDVVDGREDGFLYTRYGMNPTIRNLEAKLAHLDGAESSLAFSSGMAALSSLFLSHGRQGIICLGDAYGGTLELLSSQLPGLGIQTHQLLLAEIDKLDALLATGVGLVFFETPTNPRLELIDIRRISELAHVRGALVAVDNTFATPVNQRPLTLGADIAMQSATKYLGGHSDLTAGVLSADKRLLLPIQSWRKNLGQMIAPEVAHKLSRSLATLVIRVEKHNANAMAVATFLHEHEAVKQVYYPGLPDSSDHTLASNQMSGFGGMVTFEVNASAQYASRFIESLKIFSLAPSLGGVESLATQPVTTSHHDMALDERKVRGISDTMIRLSVGIEDERDLIDDLDQALARAFNSCGVPT
jgi:cystathionine gamma-synthase